MTDLMGFHGTTKASAASILKDGLRGGESGCALSSDPLIAIAYGVLSAWFAGRYDEANDALLENVALLQVHIRKPEELMPDEVFARRVQTGLFKDSWSASPDDFGYELLDRALNTEIFDLGVDLPADYIEQLERWWVTVPPWDDDAGPCPISGIESLRFLRSARLSYVAPTETAVLDVGHYWPRP